MHSFTPAVASERTGLYYGGGTAPFGLRTVYWGDTGHQAWEFSFIRLIPRDSCSTCFLYRTISIVSAERRIMRHNDEFVYTATSLRCDQWVNALLFRVKEMFLEMNQSYADRPAEKYMNETKLHSLTECIRRFIFTNRPVYCADRHN